MSDYKFSIIGESIGDLVLIGIFIAGLYFQNTTVMNISLIVYWVKVGVGTFLAIVPRGILENKMQEMLTYDTLIRVSAKAKSVAYNYITAIINLGAVFILAYTHHELLSFFLIINFFGWQRVFFIIRRLKILTSVKH